MTMEGDKAEIAFFDLETTIPTQVGQGYAILEFGAILVCPRKLIELENYSTLVRPNDLSRISSLSVRCNGITKDAVVSAPSFGEIADKVYDLLHGRIWAGHNILRFDCPRLREAFAEINRPAPEPRGTLDSLAILTQKFGRRAGNMKMATLATYFGLGQQTHRSLDDVRMNLEVLKYCATVLFLESSLPDIFTENSWVSPNAITRSRSNGKTPQGSNRNANTPSPSSKTENSPPLPRVNHMTEEPQEPHPIIQFMTPSTSEVVSNHATSNSTTLDPFNMFEQANSNCTTPDPFNMSALIDEVGREPIPSEETMEEVTSVPSSLESSTQITPEGTVIDTDFLEPDEVSIPSINACLVPFYRGTQKIKILHNDVPLQLWCKRTKVRFGISTKFLESGIRPRFNFVVNASPSVCRVLEPIDNLAYKLFLDSGSNSEWWPVVNRKLGYENSPTLRLQLPSELDGGIIRWGTEIYQEESSTMQRLAFSRFEPTELESLLTPGTYVDAYFSVDGYDYQQNAGVRLVLQKLILHSR